MRLIAILSLLMLSVSAWAGTFRDDFEDGNWDGWELFAGHRSNINAVERFSITEGVLHIDARVNSMDTTGYEMGLILMGDWRDYSFSADMRIVQPDPGH